MVKCSMSFVQKTCNRFSILLLFLILISSQPVCSDNRDILHTPLFDYKVVNTFPHDEKAFTQGLVFENGMLYEGTGLYGKSALTMRTLDSIEVLQTYRLPSSLFGEGITYYNNSIIQLTWRAGVGFIYDPSDFRVLTSFSFSTEGWGITNNGHTLIMSDGTDNIYFLDPENLKETRRIKVTDNKNPVTSINELEYIKGKIYANIWKSDRIAIIHPDSGQVEGWIHLTKLVRKAGGDNKIKTLNGIAYDNENDRIFVTGKLWPEMYEIKIITSK